MHINGREGQVKAAVVGKIKPTNKEAFRLDEKSARNQYAKPEGRTDFSEKKNISQGEETDPKKAQVLQNRIKTSTCIHFYLLLSDVF